MSGNHSLHLHACLAAASITAVLLATASLLPQAARSVPVTAVSTVSAKGARLASVSLPAIIASNEVVKDESRVPARD